MLVKVYNFLESSLELGTEPKWIEERYPCITSRSNYKLREKEDELINLVTPVDSINISEINENQYNFCNRQGWGGN